MHYLFMQKKIKSKILFLIKTNENLFPHPKNIKVCEAEIEVAALNKPEIDIPKIIPEGAPLEDFVLAPTLRVTSVRSMKKIDQANVI